MMENNELEVIRYCVIETALCLGIAPISGEVSMVRASDYDAAQSELAELREELDRQKRYVEINANSAHGKHKEGQQYKYERDALREGLATLQRKHERTESALNGSMKALTRVDNMWKKRWLDKTGEPSTSLIVDDEFKALFEEIKDYRKRLTAAEQRNAVIDIEAAAKMMAACMDYPWEHMPENGRALMRKHAKDVVDAALKPTESGASE